MARPAAARAQPRRSPPRRRRNPPAGARTRWWCACCADRRRSGRAVFCRREAGALLPLRILRPSPESRAARPPAVAFSQRQEELELGALIDLGELDASAVAFRDAAHHREAQTGPRRLG